MKKIISICLAAAMLLTLGACGSKETLPTESETESTSSSSDSSTEDALESSEETTEESSEESSEEIFTPEKGLGYFVEEQVLVDQDDIKITLLAGEVGTQMTDPEVNVVVENNTGRDIELTAVDGTINGWFSGTHLTFGEFSREIPAGETKNMRLVYFLDAEDELDRIHIAEAHLTFQAKMEDENGDVVRIYMPARYETSLYDGTTPVITQPGTVIYEDEMFVMTCVRMKYDYDDNPANAQITISNKSDQTLNFYPIGSGVNGKEGFVSWSSSTLDPGTAIMTHYKFTESNYETFGLEDTEGAIESFTFTVRVGDPETDDMLYVTDTITVNTAEL